VKGWSIGQVITSELFGIESDRSLEVEKSTDQRRKLLKKESLNDAEKAKLDSLNLEIDGLPFGDTKKESDAMKILKDLAASMDITKSKNDDKNK